MLQSVSRRLSAVYIHDVENPSWAYSATMRSYYAPGRIWQAFRFLVTILAMVFKREW